MTQHKLLGRYTLLRELGRDATGMVYQARDQANGAIVALQTLDPALAGAGDPNLADAFLRNARAASRLRHANIVRVHDCGEAGGTAYVATDLAEGESLRRMLDARPLPLARAIRIFEDIASALAYAHEQGMVHRGVRPSNIVVGPSGVARIGDFGIGQIGEDAQRYLSPEQVSGEPVDPRSDLFSLGAVFYEMLTRRPAFAGGSPREIRENILESEPPRPSEVNPHVPAALDALVLGLLERRPEDRFADARAVLRELHRLEQALGLRPVVAAATAAEPAPASVRQPVRDAPRFSAIDEPDERVMRHRALQREQRRGSRSNALAAVALALAAVSIGLTVAFNYFPGAAELLSRMGRGEEAPVTTTAAPAPPVAPATVTKVEEQLPAVPAPAPAPEPSPAIQAKKDIPPPPVAQPAGTAKLVVAVSPQGELYVDGKHYGTTPPTTTFDLEPGMHRIEIRSGARKPYLTYMTVEPGEERRIRHDFNAKPMRPPV